MILTADNGAKSEDLLYIIVLIAISILDIQTRTLIMIRCVTTYYQKLRLRAHPAGVIRQMTEVQEVGGARE
jgi:hypothetical protein